MHLRPRTNTIGAVARIRNALSWATHDFFQTHGFLYLHTPLITTSDCEGAGEMFQVLPLCSSTAGCCDAHNSTLYRRCVRRDFSHKAGTLRPYIR